MYLVMPIMQHTLQTWHSQFSHILCPHTTSWKDSSFIKKKVWKKLQLIFSKRRTQHGMLQASTNSSISMKNALLGMAIMSKSRLEPGDWSFFGLRCIYWFFAGNRSATQNFWSSTCTSSLSKNSPVCVCIWNIWFEDAENMHFMQLWFLAHTFLKHADL